jgi:hypothetical protein
MMPDDHRGGSLKGDAQRADAELRVAEIVARCGNIYMRSKLSPPSRLRDAVKHWLALSLDEIVDVLQRHLDENRHMYLCGSADGNFWQVERDIRQEIERKHPVPHVEEPKPQPRRRRVIRVHTASGIPDLIVDDPTARIPRGQATPVEGPSILRGYESAGEPILEDDEAD